MTIETSVLLVRAALVVSDDLRRTPWKGAENPYAGHCYVASEVLCAMLGPEWRPCFIRHEGSPHWFLRHLSGAVIDATGDQFATPVPYERATGKGFLTAQPSKRARILMSRIAPARSARRQSEAA